jgi:septin family protein
MLNGVNGRTHMEELKEKTSDVLYENYRSDKLMSMGVEQDQTVFKEVKYPPLPPILVPSASPLSPSFCASFCVKY